MRHEAAKNVTKTQWRKQDGTKYVVHTRMLQKHCIQARGAYEASLGGGAAADGACSSDAAAEEAADKSMAADSGANSVSAAVAEEASGAIEAGSEGSWMLGECYDSNMLAMRLRVWN